MKIGIILSTRMYSSSLRESSMLVTLWLQADRSTTLTIGMFSSAEGAQQRCQAPSSSVRGD